VSTIQSVEDSIASVLAEDSHAVNKLNAITSIFIAERWEARHGKHSAWVSMDDADTADFNTWLDINMSSYRGRSGGLRRAIQDISEIFPGMPLIVIVDAMLRYF
jgi:hypothetical protein